MDKKLDQKNTDTEVSEIPILKGQFVDEIFKRYGINPDDDSSEVKGKKLKKITGSSSVKVKN